MTGIEIFCGIIAILVLFYYYLVAPYNLWKKQGVSGPNPLPFFGNAMPLMLGKQSISTFTAAFYEKYKKEPMVGIFMRREPALVINDPDLIKTVLIKDFTKFSDRGINFNEVAEPLSAHLFSLEPKRWRPFRTRLSPVFTSGKLKEMFNLILECSDGLLKYLETLLASGDIIDCRELAARYTTDVIGTCAFGINMNSISPEESEFRKVGKAALSTKLSRFLRFRINDIMPWFYGMISYVIPYPDNTEFFMKSVLDMIEYRKKNNIVRNDFINTLIDLKAHPDKLQDIILADHILVAQAFVFFIAGFETSSSTISNALYELAQSQDIQDKLREEIKQHEKKYNGVWEYENIKMMPILDAVFKETLRKYPPVEILRKSVEDYTFEGINVWIPKGTSVFISAYGIHHDPDIFPNPEVFDINRFNEEEVAKRHSMNFLPFGDGPRNCIGARFAIFQTKISLIKILRNYKVDICSKTVIPYEINQRAFLLTPNHPITLKVTKIQD